MKSKNQGCEDCGHEERLYCVNCKKQVKEKKIKKVVNYGLRIFCSVECISNYERKYGIDFYKEK